VLTYGRKKLVLPRAFSLPEIATIKKLPRTFVMKAAGVGRWFEKALEILQSR